MIVATVDSQIPNQVTLSLDIQGPLATITGEQFDPSRDLHIYVNGIIQTVDSYSYVAQTNSYVMYTDSNLDLTGVIQVIHHMPNPPFLSFAGAPVLVGFGSNFGSSFGS